MKKLRPTLMLGCALVAACALLLVSSPWPPAQAKAAAAPIKIEVTVTIGKARQSCAGFGICKITLGGSTATKRSVRGELDQTADGKLSLRLLSKAPDETATLAVDQDILLSRDIATKLGVKSATILRGEYAFSSSQALLNAKLLK